ncbi:methyltransferase domain-containing protein [Hippea jasoniae]|uniref:methyltransferase domain-containing protein n=1 Tax=Hippea jasoniae TaxID=944479 RepID=UPI000B0F9EEF|nr:methyltransferase domain-containing protein [Hippea jasoniae]
MRKNVALGVDVDKKTLWSKHFGMSPYYLVFDRDGNFIREVENPFAKQKKHHDDPSLIVELLDDVFLFIAKAMGQKSRQRLTNEFKIETLITDKNSVDDAIAYYLDVKRNIDVFERCFEKYEAWFDKYAAVYESELNMLKAILPPFERALEVGVGSGRFAAPLGIKEGVEPSSEMAKIATERGIKIYPAFAENLPLENNSYDFVLIAVTICFVKDPKKTLKEAYRVLKEDGKIVVAIVDRETQIGKEYLNKKEKGQFYRYVNFFSTEEIHRLLEDAGFRIENTYQTLFGKSIKDINSVQGFREGYGEGGFVAVLGSK